MTLRNCFTYLLTLLKIGLDMASLGYKIWRNKMSNHKFNSALPPTKPAFKEHVSKAHFQECIWRSALACYPPDLNAEHFEWCLNVETNMLEPVTLPTNVLLTPLNVLK